MNDAGISWFTVAWSMAAAACLVLGSIYLLVWFGLRRKNVSHLLFAIMAFASFATALFELSELRTQSPETYLALVHWGHVPLFALLVSMVWFIHVYFKTARRWLAYTITAMWCASLVVNFVSPFTLVFSELPELRTLPSVVGEGFAVAVADVNPWKVLPDLASLLIVVYVLDASWRLSKRGESGRALRVGGAIAFFMITAGIHTPLVDAGIVQTPYMVSFAFLAIVIAMAGELGRDVVRASALAEQVEVDARRWRDVLEHIALAGVAIDNTGRIEYVNPCYERITGFARETVVGKSVMDLAPPEEAEAVRRVVENALREGPQPRTDLALHCQSGEVRQLIWSTVRLLGRDGEVEGLLTLGSDVTEQRKMEAARDEALRELTEIKDRLAAENLYLRQEMQTVGDSSEMIGTSDVLKYVLAKIEQVAKTDSTVLIEGETGVGKELVAQAIHDASPRAGKSFIKLNCAALPDHLVESELFGHERGAFTGADRRRQGRFELADGGTLLLDEVGELPPGTQAKLLRVLQDGEFERVGAGEAIRVDVRVLAATNKNLSREVAEGNFREDLFYRLHVYPITVPPLRDRREDIPLLVEHLACRIAARVGKRINRVPGDVVNQLKEHDWPGNVRELENVLERAVITSHDGVLRLPEGFQQAAPPAPAGTGTLQDVERGHILTVLESTSWRVSGPNGAATVLGLNPSTLRFRMKKLGIERK